MEININKSKDKSSLTFGDLVTGDFYYYTEVGMNTNLYRKASPTQTQNVKSGVLFVMETMDRSDKVRRVINVVLTGELE